MSAAPENAIESTNGHHEHVAHSSSSSSFDLETYISRYAQGSETRLQRLAFIASANASSFDLQQTCRQMMEQQIKQTGNVVRYKQLHPEAENADWIRTTTANNEAAQEVLEARLSAAQANLNKDAIRIAYLNLGEHSARTGHVRDALRHVLRARDYCTNRTQTGHICWNVIELAMNLSNYNQVRDYVAKAEHAVVAGDHEFPRKLKVAAGMALLGEGQYKDACQKLRQVKTPPEISCLASPEDVALYSALLACATLTRMELVHYLEEQPTVLELVPDLREALRHYVRAEYKECLQIFSSLAILNLDLHLAAHAKKLMELVRNRSYVDYLQPYRKVHLPHMATMFGGDCANLQKSLAELIGKGEIRHARIDCRTQTLEREETEEAVGLKKTEQRVQKLQETVLNDAYASIVRLACLELEPTERGGGGSRNNNNNPEDVLADVEQDSSDDDDVDMAVAYDHGANPDDGL